MLRVERKGSVTGLPGIEQKAWLFVVEQRQPIGNNLWSDYQEIERIMIPVSFDPNGILDPGLTLDKNRYRVRTVPVYGMKENPRVRKLAERILDCQNMEQVKRVFAEYSEPETDPFVKE